ncbi:hypothetical protein BDN70DRAFT_897251 [Pholiota conissans]|uniref:Uncharacterized protein n=1 Tax=Pholiota conissans TaxID=109636 RepID=A0A9P5YXP4_9AGAR|nr:hypothetical protein BDN70DRAFT_897251 [Pholiota conissans]
MLSLEFGRSLPELVLPYRQAPQQFEREALVALYSNSTRDLPSFSTLEFDFPSSVEIPLHYSKGWTNYCAPNDLRLEPSSRLTTALTDLNAHFRNSYSSTCRKNCRGFNLYHDRSNYNRSSTETKFRRSGTSTIEHEQRTYTPVHGRVTTGVQEIHGSEAYRTLGWRGIATIALIRIAQQPNDVIESGVPMHMHILSNCMHSPLEGLQNGDAYWPPLPVPTSSMYGLLNNRRPDTTKLSGKRKRSEEQDDERKPTPYKQQRMAETMGDESRDPLLDNEAVSRERTENEPPTWNAYAVIPDICGPLSEPLKAYLAAKTVERQTNAARRAAKQKKCDKTKRNKRKPEEQAQKRRINVREDKSG